MSSDVRGEDGTAGAIIQRHFPRICAGVKAQIQVFSPSQAATGPTKKAPGNTFDPYPPLPKPLPLSTMKAIMSTVQTAAKGRQFPKFDLARLLHTVFEPIYGRKVCILIDLPELAEARDMAFLDNPERAIQRRAHQYFYRGLHDGVMEELALQGGEMFAYVQTGGSNLDMPDECADLKRLAFFDQGVKLRAILTKLWLEIEDTGKYLLYVRDVVANSDFSAQFFF
jgi:hypothetical protein